MTVTGQMSRLALEVTQEVLGRMGHQTGVLTRPDDEGGVVIRCRDCGLTLGTGMRMGESPVGFADRMGDDVERAGYCVSMFYRRIPGTPWFEYGPQKPEARR